MLRETMSTEVLPVRMLWIDSRTRVGTSGCWNNYTVDFQPSLSFPPGAGPASRPAGGVARRWEVFANLTHDGENAYLHCDILAGFDHGVNGHVLNLHGTNISGPLPN